MKIYIAALLSIVVTINACKTSDNFKTKKPNIVIIHSDELAPEYLSCYGGEIPTPNIDALAQNGIRFTNAYTPASMCTPSRYSLLTGQYPGRCTGKEFLNEFPKTKPYSIAWNTNIETGKQTLAKALKKEGYTTGIVGKWHTGMRGNNSVFNFSADDKLNDTVINQKLVEYQKFISESVKQASDFDYAASILAGNYDNFPIKELAVHNIEWMTEGALRFFDEQKNNTDPFFLYVATTAVHGPRHDLALKADVRNTLEGKIESLVKYQPLREAKLKELENLPTHERHLKAGLWFLDQHVGGIINKLKELEIYENTIIMFIADHNIEPGKATCYEKGNKVPFLIHWPAQLSESKVVEALVESVDIFPTALDIAEAVNNNELKLDGFSIMPIIYNTAQEIRDYVYFESGYSRAITNGKYKYIAYRPTKSMLNAMKNGDSDYAPNYLNIPKQAHSQIAIQYYPSYFAPDQLFDLEVDPFELNNLAENPDFIEVKKEMQNTLKGIISTFEHPFSLEVDSFMYSEDYSKLAKNTKDIGTDYILWWKVDHGKVKWPPEN